MLTRDVEGLLAAVDSFARAAGKPEPEAEPAVDGDVESVPLPELEEGVSAADIPEDPEEIKELILSEVREQLGWDGTSGDPNASKDALEDALSDMFDADVEIVWDGESQLILRVEGEDPIPLTVDSLGELLEALAMHGADDGEEDGEEDEDAGEDDEDEAGDGAADERGGEPEWMRSGVLDKDKHLHAPQGVGGGRFISKGGAVGGILDKAKNVAAKTPAGKLAAGAAKLAPKTPAGKLAKGAAKVAAKTPAGKMAKSTAKLAHKTPAGKLAARIRGRSGPRQTAKAVGTSLSLATGSRVKTAGKPDGTFTLGAGPLKKTVSSKKAAALTIAAWTAGAAGAGVLGAMLGPVGLGAAAVGVGAAIDVAAVTQLVRIIRSRKKG